MPIVIRVSFMVSLSFLKVWNAVIAAIAAMFCGIAVFVIRHHVAR